MIAKNDNSFFKISGIVYNKGNKYELNLNSAGEKTGVNKIFISFPLSVGFAIKDNEVLYCEAYNKCEISHTLKEDIKRYEMVNKTYLPILPSVIINKDENTFLIREYKTPISDSKYYYESKDLVIPILHLLRFMWYYDYGYYGKYFILRMQEKNNKYYIYNYELFHKISYNIYRKEELTPSTIMKEHINALYEELIRCDFIKNDRFIEYKLKLLVEEFYEIEISNIEDLIDSIY